MSTLAAKACQESYEKLGGWLGNMLYIYSFSELSQMDFPSS